MKLLFNYVALTLAVYDQDRKIWTVTWFLTLFV
jgi:hypothetical protein